EQMIQVKASLDNRTNPRLNLPGCQAYFYSVFQNLFDNALKFRNPYKSLIITVSQQQVSGKIAILFSDNGIGMDLDRVQGQLFKQHQRFHAETEGHGMGLYLVKTQVEAMGGTVRVESRPGAGTTFLLTFSL
ncbi:MAG TPA: ATP-binding protein, partial [Adhaeribacter sp.]|nr:ATP-binding protein [Adhaeribacter sp.]